MLTVTEDAVTSTDTGNEHGGCQVRSYHLSDSIQRFYLRFRGHYKLDELYADDRRNRPTPETNLTTAYATDATFQIL
jgi:hypothetical protein